MALKGSRMGFDVFIYLITGYLTERYLTERYLAEIYLAERYLTAELRRVQRRVSQSFLGVIYK
ncbi:MAG: hypothetical protein U1D70_11390 [Methylobacter sp.]|nr:hypothetical protein [Methylobacter sp.]MDP2426619.1 hypothetical protein [Methylobacter sp.]MDP3055437.1 hypothetical protein [Methylobacter sp.]MDP3364297.1 hypothetical protein [Methylobacter sp.]MDZ4219610.1 hypothetical protein [Methylobacter sp.]